MRWLKRSEGRFLTPIACIRIDTNMPRSPMGERSCVCQIKLSRVRFTASWIATLSSWAVACARLAFFAFAPPLIIDSALLVAMKAAAASSGESSVESTRFRA
jgi:hypothetical protein